MAVDPPKLFRIGKRPAASAEKARPAIIESHVQGADPPFCSASSTTTKKEGGGGARKENTQCVLYSDPCQRVLYAFFTLFFFKRNFTTFFFARAACISSEEVGLFFCYRNY